jgi:uncharacterized protein (DUF1684 family)
MLMLNRYSLPLLLSGQQDKSRFVDCRAYYPWCAYSEYYSCPLPPRENWLPVAIRAGEKNFK